MNDCGVWMVADGMGGHPAGDVAANTAVAVATQRARARAPRLHDHPNGATEFMTDVVTSANRRIHDLMLEKPSLRGMGTTFVSLAITPIPMPIAHIAHLGDSRAYLYRAGQLTQLTRDHTLDRPTADGTEIRRAAGQCLKRVPLERRLRLLGCLLYTSPSPRD